MKRIDSTPKAIVCQNADSPFGYFAWPSVARLEDGALAMSASGFRVKHICPFGKGVLCYSRDEGGTWTRPAVIIDTPLDDRDSGVVPFGKGRVIFTSFNNTMDFQSKVNSWKGDFHSPSSEAEKNLIGAYIAYVRTLDSEERYIGSTYRISEDGGYTFGPLRRSPVTAPHGPLALRGGGLLYIGRRFSSDDSFTDPRTPYVQCWRLNDRDEFEHVSGIQNIEDDYGALLSCEPHALELPDGRILVHIRVQRGGEHPVFTVYQSESSDGGRTFSQPRRLLGEQGGSPAHLLRHSGGALVSVYGYRQPPYGIRAMFSLDGGRTWDADYVLDDTGESGDLGYPATVELSDGRLLTVYYENRGGVSVIMQQIWTLPALKN